MNRKTQICFVVGALIIGLVASTLNAQKSSGYHLVDTIQVGGEGGWDALTVDSDAHRLYVSHATHVVVINTTTDKVVGDIPNTNGVHDIAIADRHKRGFTSNGRDNSVTIFDTATLKATGTVTTGKVSGGPGSDAAPGTGVRRCYRACHEARSIGSMRVIAVAAARAGQR